jgi:hypothetical protein
MSFSFGFLGRVAVAAGPPEAIRRHDEPVSETG